MLTPDALPCLFKEHERIFVAGSSAEPRPFVEALADASKELPEIHIVNSFVPGVNRVALVQPDNRITETVIFPRCGLLPGKERIRQMPLSYFGFCNYLRHTTFDWAVIQLSEPDSNGDCSLGTSVEFMPTVLRNSKRVLGIINSHMPDLPGSPRLNTSTLDERIEADFPVITYDVGAADDVSAKIAANVEALIEDGSTLQIGLGKMPDKLIASLEDRKNLRFHSGMLSDSFIALARAGALDSDFTHVTCSALGSNAFYESLKEISNLKICGVEQTHAAENLLKLDRFAAINSALEIDLFGQANLETVNGKPVSGAGGAPDFARAARNIADGTSIVALPATAAKGSVSRIVPKFGEHTPVSFGRCDVDYVVTEHGAAKLEGHSVDERAKALIEIAAPAFQDGLEESWQQSRKR